MVKIEWTHEAEIWLRDIYNYIATDNRDAARRTVAGIFEKVQLLTKYPRLGHPYEPEQSREVRILLYGHYRIAYLIKPDENYQHTGRISWPLNIERYLI